MPDPHVGSGRGGVWGLKLHSPSGTALGLRGCPSRPEHATARIGKWVSGLRIQRLADRAEYADLIIDYTRTR